MISPAPAARNTVRGFQATPVASGDEDSDYGACETPRQGARRGRPGRIDDVVSANCSPILRGAPSPGVSGIAKLRMQLDPLNLDGSAADTPRSASRDGARSEAGSESSENGSTSYEVNLEHDFVSESIQDNIVRQKLVLPYFLSPDAKDLLTRLLRKEPQKRLGSVMPRDLQTLKKHRFFRKIDWRKLEARELEPPIQPMITDPELAENFAPEFTELALSPVVTAKDAWAVGGTPASGHKDDVFGGFSFVASSSLLESNAFPVANGV
ncbi:hypothetical protein ACCO45_000963 [Purpureocillium lilacinum]|uniref:Uncharacterized protein n=1 Tax=Purpureocillium lilacinum TaxID=33203 RepID=A0ACC4E8A4_PURLI